MARKGRKRKWRGQKLAHTKEVAVERAPDDRIRASLQPHRRCVREEDRLSEKAESPLGRLNLRDVITDEQYEAGLRYALIVGQYQAIIGVPRSTSGAGRGFPCTGEATCGAVAGIPCLCRERRVRYDAAFEALMGAGQRAAKAVARVAVWREEAADVEHLRTGLINLARHFGLTGRRDRSTIRNTNCGIAPELDRAPT